ncbi:MAG: efflux RND transporter periplasmic adaptor subunit [Planctomycetales bacterium]|nr:efflux RND transporter periplasmic adaptor subunit [Planctomycetales bacterium]
MPTQANSSTPSQLAPDSLVGAAKGTTQAAAGAASPVKPQAASPCEPRGIPAEAPVQPQLDWNACHPDGTPAALQSVLAHLAQAFRGEVYVALEGERTRTAFHASPAVESPTLTPLIRSAATEAAHTGTACLFAAEGGQSSLVLQQLRESKPYTLVLSFAVNWAAPVAAGGLRRVGVVICVPTAQQLQAKETYARLIAQTQNEWKSWLDVWSCCRSATTFRRWHQRLHFYRGHQGKLTLTLLLVLLACLAIPLPYWPSRECTVEPASKSFVASPIDGRIQDVAVRPGDVVRRGDLLARLDDEPLRWELSAAQADYQAASKRRDAALATRAGGEQRLAQLEQERISLTIESLEQQLQRLELRSPTDGIIVQGDWFQSDGAPVSRGDMLFEIAPMERMQIEIHLSTDDLARIDVGDTATVRVDAAPGAKWSADLTRIDPRGKVIDSEVVFAAEIEVDNSAHQLRPGMRGTARLSAGSQTIGWLLFHRPSQWLMKKLAW